MDTRQELLHIIEQLSDEQLSVLLDVALAFKNGKISAQPMVLSQGYQDWVSAENDIYDELFTEVSWCAPISSERSLNKSFALGKNFEPASWLSMETKGFEWSS